MKKKVILSMLIVASLSLTVGCSSEETKVNTNANEDIEEPVEDTEIIEKDSLEDGEETLNSIILEEGHPMYYGTLESAKEYSENYPKKTIVVDDSNGFDSDKTVLLLDGFDELITDIQIYPENYEGVITEKDALEIVESYLPYDILNQYHEMEEPYKYIPDDSEKNTYKIIEFTLTNEGSEQSSSEDKSYGRVAIVLEESDEGVIVITIRTTQPTWMTHSKKNGYETEEWNPDFKAE